MPHFMVFAAGRDRPGIVAAVTQALLPFPCNIEDSAMTILRGQFSMMLLVSAPEGVTPARLEEALEAPASELGLVLAVRQVAEAPAPPPPSRQYVVSVYGVDRPGIVHGISSLLASREVNIVDLETRLLEGDGGALYVMIMEVTLPEGLDPKQLEGELKQRGRELGVEVSLRPLEVETF